MAAARRLVRSDLGRLSFATTDFLSTLSTTRRYQANLQDSNPDVRDRSGWDSLGYFMPLYLSPFLLWGTKRSRCWYGVLLSLVWWAVNVLPKPITAFLPIAIFPLLDVMSADTLASHYLSAEVLLAVAFILIAVVADRITLFVPRVLFTVALWFGVHMRWIFFAVSLVAFLTSLVAPEGMTAVVIAFFCDGVFRYLEQNGFDPISELLLRPYRSPFDASNRMHAPDTDILLDQLAIAMRKASIRSRRRRRLGQPRTVAPGRYSRRSSLIARTSRASSEVPSAPGQSAGPGQSRPESEAATRRSSKLEQQQKSVGIANETVLTEATLPESTTHKGAPSRQRSSVTFIADKDDLVGLCTSSSWEHSTMPTPPTNKDIAQARSPSSGTSEQKFDVLSSKSNQARFEAQTSESLQARHDTETSESSLPEATTGDPLKRRPSILKVQDESRLLARRRQSQVEFGRTDVREIADDDSSLRYGTGPPNAAPSSCTPTPERTTEIRRLAPLGQRYRSSVTCLTADSYILEMNDEFKRSVYTAFRNTLMMGPTLMTITATTTSFCKFPATTVLKAYFNTSPAGLWRWTIITFPGSLLSSAVGCVYIYVSFLRENEFIMDAAVEPPLLELSADKLKELGPRKPHERLLCCCLATYPCIYLFGEQHSLPFVVITAMVILISTFFYADKRTLTRHVIASRFPWNIILVSGCAQALSKAIEDNNLVGVGFQSVESAFWEKQSPLTTQIVLATVAALLAETMNNATLSRLLMPMLFDIAADTRTHPVYYAIPVAVGAASNLILPVSLPLVVLHEMAEIPMRHILIAGIAMKTVLLGTLILCLNTTGRYVLETTSMRKFANYSQH